MTYILKQSKNPMHFLSWGIGVQSTTLGVMLALGDLNLNKDTVIVNADTLFEHSYTYETREFYTKWFNEHGLRTEIVNSGDASNTEDIITLPLWTINGGPLRRQCTGDYKIQPIRKKVRELLGVSLKNGGRTAPGSVIMYLGISYDEAERMKDSDRNYIINMYPLVDNRITRKDCEDYLRSKNLPVPLKSCCINCPYQGMKQWKFVKENYPEDFQKAIDYDEKIRIPKKRMLDRGLYTKDLFIYKGLEPLKDAVFDTEKAEIFDVCDSGYCFI